MITAFCFKKLKLLMFSTLVAFVVIVTISSDERIRLDTFGIKVKAFDLNYVKSIMTFGVPKEINQQTMKSELPHILSITTETSHNGNFKVKIKPGLMKIINPSTPKFALTINGSYLLEDKNRCSSVTNLSILIMVLSSPSNFERRNVIRETWANNSFYSSCGKVKVLFLLGTIYSSDVQDTIQQEFKINKDIVQGSFVDSYHNLSHKSVMGYKWATDRCRNAKYIIKTDDDIVINMFRILKNDMHMLSVNQFHVQCRRLYHSGIFRTIHHKFYVESKQFKGWEVYPPYCNGQYVMILNELVPYLYEAAMHTPFFWIDDVFMYGLVMSNIPALKYNELSRKDYEKYSDRTSINCFKRKKPECRCIYYVIKNNSQTMLVWSAFVKQYISNAAMP